MIEKYLIKARLPWKSVSISNGAVQQENGAAGSTDTPDERYLAFEIGQEVDPDVYAVLPNDWPYNVPKDVEHIVVWSKVSDNACLIHNSIFTTARDQLPIFHPALVDHDAAKWARIQQDGFAGFTGKPKLEPPPVTPSAGQEYSSLQETGAWGWCTEGGREVAKMVTTLWPTDEFECIWVSLGQFDGKEWYLIILDWIVCEPASAPICSWAQPLSYLCEAKEDGALDG